MGARGLGRNAAGDDRFGEWAQPVLDDSVEQRRRRLPALQSLAVKLNENKRSVGHKLGSEMCIQNARIAAPSGRSTSGSTAGNGSRWRRSAARTISPTDPP